MATTTDTNPVRAAYLAENMDALTEYAVLCFQNGTSMARALREICEFADLVIRGGLPTNVITELRPALLTAGYITSEDKWIRDPHTTV